MNGQEEIKICGNCMHCYMKKGFIKEKDYKEVECRKNRFMRPRTYYQAFDATAKQKAERCNFYVPYSTITYGEVIEIRQWFKDKGWDYKYENC